MLPLADHRGYAREAVRAWTHEQTFDRERYELIVGFDGVEAGLEDSVSDLLGPEDRPLDGASRDRHLRRRGAGGARADRPLH